MLFFLIFLKCLIEDAAKGLSLGPILGRFNSSRMAGKKGSVAFIEYQLLVAATNNFQDNNVLGEGGFGRVYKARFSDNVLAAVKRLHGGNQDARREFEVRMLNLESLCWYWFSFLLVWFVDARLIV